MIRKVNILKHIMLEQKNDVDIYTKSLNEMDKKLSNISKI